MAFEMRAKTSNTTAFSEGQHVFALFPYVFDKSLVIAASHRAVTAAEVAFHFALEVRFSEFKAD